MLYVVGGTETVAVALQWYPKFMANLPHVQHKLRAHLLERIPELQDREMTYDDVASGRLPYLEAVVYEVLRMARVAPALAREGKSTWSADQGRARGLTELEKEMGAQEERGELMSSDREYHCPRPLHSKGNNDRPARIVRTHDGGRRSSWRTGPECQGGRGEGYRERDIQPSWEWLGKRYRLGI